jgi:hypothetical protein
MDITLNEKKGTIVLKNNLIIQVVWNILKRIENIEVENVVFESMNKNNMFFIFIKKNVFFNDYNSLKYIERTLQRQIAFNLNISNFEIILKLSK